MKRHGYILVSSFTSSGIRYLSIIFQLHLGLLNFVGQICCFLGLFLFSEIFKAYHSKK